CIRASPPRYQAKSLKNLTTDPFAAMVVEWVGGGEEFVVRIFRRVCGEIWLGGEIWVGGGNRTEVRH
ncbi:MAG: hypothetical protein LUD39_01695, partial [Opitutae bacterium]|nr:hypothetical protein [Opitutae bacterium]